MSISHSNAIDLLVVVLSRLDTLKDDLGKAPNDYDGPQTGVPEPPIPKVGRTTDDQDEIVEVAIDVTSGTGEFSDERDRNNGGWGPVVDAPPSPAPCDLDEYIVRVVQPRSLDLKSLT